MSAANPCRQLGRDPESTSLALPQLNYFDPCRAMHAQRASRSDRLVTPSYRFRHGGASHFLSEEENITVALGLTELLFNRDPPRAMLVRVACHQR